MSLDAFRSGHSGKLRSDDFFGDGEAVSASRLHGYALPSSEKHPHGCSLSPSNTNAHFPLDWPPGHPLTVHTAGMSRHTRASPTLSRVSVPFRHTAPAQPPRFSVFLSTYFLTLFFSFTLLFCYVQPPAQQKPPPPGKVPMDLRAKGSTALSQFPSWDPPLHRLQPQTHPCPTAFPFPGWGALPPPGTLAAESCWTCPARGPVWGTVRVPTYGGCVISLRPSERQFLILPPNHCELQTQG